MIAACKHCGLQIESRSPRGWVHLEGPRERMHSCAVEPFGYDAAPEGEECSSACLGSNPYAGEPQRP